MGYRGNRQYSEIPINQKTKDELATKTITTNYPPWLEPVIKGNAEMQEFLRQQRRSKK
jgi:hypothetical protein